MNTMRIILFGLTFIISNMASAEIPPAVHLTIEDSSYSEGSIQDPITIEASQSLMGNELPNRMEISVAKGTVDSILATPLAGTISLVQQQTKSAGVLVVVGAKLHPEKDVADQRHFKSLERPVIEKHQGEVLISLATSPSSQWPFDIVELVSFPSLEHYQRLMNDPAYAPDTALGQAMMTTYTQDLSVAVATIE